MSTSDAAWRTVYTAVTTQFGSQYAPLLSGPQVEAKSVEFADQPVDAANATQRVRLLLDFAKAGLRAGEHDLLDQLSIDRLDRDTVRVRPLSYEFHRNFHAALDARTVLKAGITEKFKTLREELSRAGRPHPVDSDIAPAKLGVCALVMDRKGGRVRILETHRARHLAIYPDTRHASFSGGVEKQDLSADDPGLSGLITRAAIRECKEEIGVDIRAGSVTVLGLWREMERCSVQSFAVAVIEDLDALAYTPDPAELQSFRIRPLKEPWHAGLLRKAKSAELDFLEKFLATTSFGDRRV